MVQSLWQIVLSPQLVNSLLILSFCTMPEILFPISLLRALCCWMLDISNLTKNSSLTQFNTKFICSKLLWAMGLNQNVHTCTGFHAIIIVFLVESGDCFQFCITVIDGFLMPSLTDFYGEDSVVGPHFVDGFCLTIPLFQVSTIWCDETLPLSSGRELPIHVLHSPSIIRWRTVTSWYPTKNTVCCGINCFLLWCCCNH